MKRIKWKRVVSALMVIVLVMSNVPATALATDDTIGLCEHHGVHTDCGYEEGASNCGYVCEICNAGPEPTGEETLEPSEPEPTGEETLESSEPEPTSEETLEPSEPEPTAEDPLEPEVTEEPTKPVCTGLADCVAENHLDECEIKSADDGIMVAAEGTLKDSGVCGENARWEYYYVPREDSGIGDNVLYIIGTGDMTDFASKNDVPWPTGVLKVLDEVYISEGITSIGNYSFYNQGIDKIILPDSVTRIGDYAFAHSTLLEYISFSKNLVSIGEAAFRGCRKLSNLSFPDSLKTIGNQAFYDCDGLEYVVCPDSVTDIGSETFSICTNLKSVRLSSSLTEIEDSLFFNCKSLSSVNIPAKVTSIGASAFAYCGSLNYIQFPSGLLSIDEYAFDTLADLVISYWPLSLTTIHKYAFGSTLVYVTDVYYEGTEQDRAKINDGNEYYLPLHNANWYYGASAPAHPTNLGCGIQAQVVNESDAVTVYGGWGQASTHILLTYEDGISSIPVAAKDVDFVVTNTATNQKTNWGTVSTNEDGIVTIPLNIMAVPFKENVSLIVQIARVGENEVNAEYSIPITVTVTSHTPLEQSWELSKAQALKLGASIGGGAQISGFDFKASALELGISGGSGAGMGISHNVDEHGHRELSLSGQIKTSFGSEIGTGIKLSVDGLKDPEKIEGDVIAANASVEQDNFKNYSMTISNYAPDNNEHQKAVALFLLNQFFTMFSQNALLFQLTNKINMKSEHEDIHYEIGTGKMVLGELEADAGVLEWQGKKIISAVGSSAKVVSQTENTRDNFGTITHNSSLETNVGLNMLSVGQVPPVLSGKFLLGPNSSAKAIIPFAGTTVLQISGIEQGASTGVLWYEWNEKNSRTYEIKYSDAAFTKCLENVDGILEFINDGGIVSQSNYEDLSKFIDSSNDPIQYVNSKEITEGANISLKDFEVSAGLGIGASCEVAYQSTSSHPYLQGFTLNGYDYTCYESDEGVSGSITLKEIIFESLDAIAGDISQWVKSVSGAIDEGIKNTQAFIEDAYDGINDIIYQVTLVTMVNESAANESMQIDVINPTEPALMSLEVETEDVDNLRGAFTVGTPVIITVKDPETGENVDDFSYQPMELTLQFRTVDQEETGITPDELQEGRIIGICRYLEEQNCYEFCGGVYNLEDQSVTTQITKPGQYVLAILDHNWQNATCTSPKTCSDCGAVEGEPTDHSYGDWETGTDATCTETGKKQKICVCGDVVTEEILALGHSFEQRGEQIICTVCNNELTLRVGQDYVVLDLLSGHPAQLAVEVTPSHLADSVQWELEGEDGIVTVETNGKVIACSEGTAHVMARLTYGEFEVTSRCRIDVTATLQIDGVQLSTSSVTTELFSTNYTGLEILLQLPQNYPVDTLAAASDAAMAAGDNGIIVESARFSDETMAKLFDLVVLDDRRVQVVPTDYAVKYPNAVNSKYTGSVVVTIQGKAYKSEELTLSVKKSSPKLKAEVETFNSFYSGTAQEIVITGGTPTKITAASLPNWLTLEDNLLTVNEKAPQKSTTAKVTLLVQTQEWRIPEEVTLSVKNKYKAPGIKLSDSSIKMSEDVKNSNGVELTLKPKSSKDTLKGLNVTGITAPAGYSIANFNQEDGTFVLKAAEGFASGKITLNVTFSDTAVKLPLTLTVKTAVVTLKASVKTLTLNTALNDTAQIDLTATPADYRITAPSFRLTDSKGVDKTGELTVWFENGSVFVSNTEATPAGASYKLYISAGGSKEVSVTIKTVSGEPSVTFKAKSSFDLSFPEKAAEVTPTFKNYNGAFTVTGMTAETSKKEVATDKFDVEVDGKTILVTAKDDTATGTYTLNLKLKLEGGSVCENTVKVSVKRTAVKLKLSATKLTLNKAILESGSVDVTCTTKGYDFTAPVVELSSAGKLDVTYAKGTLTVATNAATEYGATYKVLVKANANAPAVTLTVTIPAQAKSTVTAALKASGSLDVIREGKGVTVTPTYKNIKNLAGVTESLVFYSSADNYTNAVKGLFRYEPNGKGGYIVTRADGADLDHSLKYKVELVSTVGGISVVSAKVAIKVTMGSAKLTLNAASVDLFAKDKYDRAEFTMTAKDTALNIAERVEIKDAKYKDLFEIYTYGNGEFAIGFKDGKVDSSLITNKATKTVTVTLNVWIEGNETAKVNTTVKLKVNVVK